MHLFLCFFFLYVISRKRKFEVENCLIWWNEMSIWYVIQRRLSTVEKSFYQISGIFLEEIENKNLKFLNIFYPKGGIYIFFFVLYIWLNEFQIFCFVKFVCLKSSFHVQFSNLMLKDYLYFAQNFFYLCYDTNFQI